MRVELIETEDALRALEPVWESLWRADPAADVFTSFDWFLNWWEHFGHGRGSYGLVMRDGDRWVSLPGRDTRLHVLVVWDQGEALAIAPLLLLHGWWQRCPVRILAPPLNNHAPRSGFLRSRASRAAVAAVVEYLARSRQWDLMLLDGIPGQSGLVPTLSEVAARRLRPGQRQLPWFHAYLAVEGTWEQYLKQKSENFRRSLRRVSTWCREHRHDAVKMQHVALSRKLRGHYAYYGVTGNFRALLRYYDEVRRIWRKWLSRRNNRGLNWERMQTIVEVFPFPRPRIVHSALRTAANP